MREILASIDIGSSKIKMIVGEIIGDKLNVLCALDEEARGVKRGAIVEPEETEYAIRKILKQSEEMLGIKISKAIVSINEESAEYSIGDATIDIENSDYEIDTKEILEVLKQSTYKSIKPNYEVVSVFPIMFKVDDKKTRIPKNMKGKTLTVKSVITIVPKRDIIPSIKCLEKCGIEVVDIMLGSNATYYAYKNETLDASTGVIVDCGDQTIKLAIVNKGIVINNLVIGFGGYNIDKDIGFVYKLNEEQSKNIKENFALANRRNASRKESENVLNLLGEKLEISQYEVSEVVMSRIQEMLSKVKNEINYLTKKEISYIIITGGLSEFKDFALNVESVFGKRASIGRIMIVGARNNEYAACIGMIQCFKEKLELRDKKFSVVSDEELDSIVHPKSRKNTSGESILGRVFGIFFDN